MSYLRDLLDLAHSQDFDAAVFQVYQSIGRSLVTSLTNDESPDHFSSSLAREFSSHLDAFKSSWQLFSGNEMEKLWNSFKPNTATDLSQLESSLLVKGLGDQYDALRFSVGTSIQETDQLQNSLIEIHDSLREGVLTAENPLTVRGKQN